MGRIWGARKPVTRLRNTRFWAWYLQQKRKARSIAKPCLDDLIGWFKFDTTNNSGDTEIVNSVDDGDNITVHGFAGTGDGVAYGNLAENVLLQGNFKIETIINPSSGDFGIFAGSWNAQIRTTGTNSPYLYLDGAGHAFSTLTVAGWSYVSYERVDSTMTVTVGEDTQSATVSTADLELETLFASNYKAIGAIAWAAITNAVGVKICDWVIESASDSDQTTFYDRVGGNHATIVNATTPFFTTKINSSVLAEGGFRKGGDNLWENPDEQYIDENNFATFDEETQNCRIVSDGTWVELTLLSIFDIGKTYEIDVIILSMSGSGIKFTSSGDPITESIKFDHVSTGANASFVRLNSAGTDTVFTATIREKNVYVPAGAATELTALPNTFAALEPCVLNAPDTQEWKDADANLGDFWFTTGVQNDIDPADLIDINYQQFIDTDIALLLYSDDIEDDCLEETNKYLGK